jgi:S-adenosylmethionine:tRNA ribosyltransferase-isomerase
MMAAVWPRDASLAERMLVVDPGCDCMEAHRVGDLTAFARAGDLVVVNDSATLPASLHGRTEDGQWLEVRLVASAGNDWRAIVFGSGDWQTRTEDRPAPPLLATGDRLVFDPDLSARVRAVDAMTGRLATLRFESEGDRFWRALYRQGRPIQYAYVSRALALWHVQTPFASVPWSSEMPSAGRPLSWELVLSMRRRGVLFEAVTHAAGLSSTGDPSLDARLPLRELYDVPARTAEAIAATRDRGSRVIAIGTTVVRALESAAANGRLRPGPGETELRLDRAHRLKVVDAILTGMHEPGTSHDALLQAFAPSDLLGRAFRVAERRGFLGHEFGDSMLVGEGLLAA